LEYTCSSVMNPSGDLESIIQNLNKITFESDKCYIESGDDNDENIYLKKGKSKEIDVVCDAGATSKKEHIIKITAYYDYYFDSNKIKVNVRGTKSAAGRTDGTAHLRDAAGTKLIEKMNLSDAFTSPYITVQINQDEDENLPFESVETISSEKIHGLTTDVLVKAVVMPGSYVDKNVLLEDVGDMYISDSGLLDHFTLADLDRIDQNNNPPNVISKQYYYYNRDAQRARNIAQRKVERDGGNLADYMPDEYSPYPEDELGIVHELNCNPNAGHLQLKDMDSINGIDDIESSTRGDTKAFEWQKINTKITKIKVPHCGERTIDELTDGKLTFIDLSQIYMNQLADVSFIGADEDYVNFVVDGIDDNEKKVVGYIRDIQISNFATCTAESKSTATPECRNTCNTAGTSNSACFSPKGSSLNTANTGEYTYICYNNRLYMAKESGGISIGNGCNDGYKCVCYDTIHSMDDETVLFCPQFE
ncbi:MAG: hypothetical protein DRN66_02275, partial [Candidatus Nanohalarchaeota archaeon]